MENLEQEKNNFRNVFKDANDPMFLIDTADGKIIDVNNSACVLLGYTHNELISRKIIELRPPEEQTVASQHFREALKNGSGRFNSVLSAKDGTVIAVDISARLIQYGNKPVILSIARDIRERSRQDEQLRFLSDTLTQFIGLNPEQDSFTFIAEKTKELAGNALVGISSVDAETNMLIPRALAGVTGMIENAMRLMGRTPIGMQMPVSDEARTMLLKGELHAVSGGLYELMFKTVSKPICFAIEKILRISGILSMGLSRSGELLGAITIITFRGEELRNRDLIRVFLRQISVGLQHKISIERERRINADLAFLSDTLAKLINLPDNADVYDFIAKKLSEHIDNAIIAAFSVHEDYSVMTIRGMAGVPAHLEPALKLLRVSPIGMTLPLKPNTVKLLSKGTFYKTEESFADLTSGLIPENLSSTLKKILNIRNVYGIGMTEQERLFGGIGIISLSENPFVDKRFFELFGHQAAIALRKKINDEKEKNHLRNLSKLSESLTQLIDTQDEQDMYELIAVRLSKLIGDCAVFVNSFDVKTGIITVRAMQGMPDPIQTGLQILGRNPIGMAFTLDAESKKILERVKLTELKGGLYELTIKQIPEPVCKAIEKATGIGRIYAMGCVKDGNLISHVSIITFSRNPITNTETIELFVNQVSTVIQKKQAEQSLLITNRALTTILEFNQYLVRCNDEQELLDALCRILVDTGGYRFVWTGYLSEEDNERLIKIKAKSGYEDGYIDALDPQWSDVDRGNSPSVIAVKSQQPFIARDIRTEPFFGPWRDEALKRGYASACAIPLIDNGQSTGCLYIYSRVTFAFDTNEILLLQQLAGDLVFGINAIRTKTYQSKMEESLRESERRFRQLFENSPIAISIQVDGINKYVNPAQLRLFGYEESELIGQSTFTQIAPEHRETIRRRAERRKKGLAEPTIYEVPGIKKDGTIFPMLVQVALMPMLEGAGIIIFVMDMTENKRAESALREGEDRFRTLVESMDDIVFTLDTQEKYTGVYGKWVERYGATPDEFVGKTALEIYGKGYGGIHHEANLRCLAGENVTYEWVITDEHGTNHYHVSLSPLRDENEKNTGIVGVGRNITQMKYLENQVAQAQKMESMGQLVAGIAHDFNNSIAAILDNAELMKMELIGGKFSPQSMIESIDTIITASNRTKDLTGQMLGFARKGKYNPLDIDVNVILKEIIKLLMRGLASTTRITIKQRLSAKNYVHADAIQLHQVFQNLFVNARDAMPDGGEITVETFDENITKEINGRVEKIPAGQYVLVSVSDTGTGIPEDVVGKIFDPFYTTKENGTGMGLATVWGILKNHGSYIDLSTETEKGTTFIIYLPAVSPNETVKTMEKHEELHKKGKILIVEDNESIVKFMRSYLKDAGFDVLIANDGRDAVELFRNNPTVDLVITDLILKTMDGPELFDRIRDINPTVKVLVMSGYFQDEKVQKMLNNGAVGFLSKPFSFDQLANAIKKALPEE